MRQPLSGSPSIQYPVDTNALLVPQGLHWVHFHGAACRNVAGQHGDGAEQGRNRDKGEGIGGSDPVQHGPHQACERQSSDHAKKIPVSVIRAPSFNTMRSTSNFCAPRAMRTPISLDRCPTI